MLLTNPNVSPQAARLGIVTTGVSLPVMTRSGLTAYTPEWWHWSYAACFAAIGNPQDLLSATDAIFARWLQKKVELVDSSGTAVAAGGGYGPDRQWFGADASGTLQGTIRVFSEGCHYCSG